MDHRSALSPDHQAVLQLVLRRRRSYPQIASMLDRDEQTIRERTHAAVRTLAPDGDLGDGDRATVIDYLLGQQDAAGRRRAEQLLADSPAASTWARTARTQLLASGVADEDGLPELPAAGAAASEPARGAADAENAENAEDTEETEHGEASAADGSDRDEDGSTPRRRVSRTGGAILLGLLAAAIILGILWLAGVFDGSEDRAAGGATNTTKRGPTSGPTDGYRVEQQINLRSPNTASKALGVASVVAQGGERRLAVVAQRVPKGSYFGLWVRGPKGARFLGFFRALTLTDDTHMSLRATAPAPKDLTSFRDLLVTRHKDGALPKQPGSTVLRGTIKRR